MYKVKVVSLFINLLLLVLFVESCVGNISTQSNSMECIRSFREFAYYGADMSSRINTAPPSAPWGTETRIPLQTIEGYRVSEIQVVASRLVGGKEEIWLVQSLDSADEAIPQSTNSFLIYQVESKKWEVVSGDIENSGLFVNDLFVTRDGDVWGRTVWDTVHGKTNLVKIPVISKFNESTRRFEFAKGGVEIPWTLFSYNFFPWPEIVLDSNDVFWVFVKNDGIYRFDPIAEATEKQADLSGINVIQTALSSDGNIYFEAFDEKIYSEENFFRITDKMLYKFDPKTKAIVSLGFPDKPWPVFSGMVAGRDDKLWLGAIGYRDLNGDWVLIHPDPEAYFASAGDVYAAPPTLMMESSDGILWYKKSLDDVRISGMAWFNPNTREGCMFTNIVSNIIEDSDRQLWLAADGKLFKYQLMP